MKVYLKLLSYCLLESSEADDKCLATRAVELAETFARQVLNIWSDTSYTDDMVDGCKILVRAL